MPATNESLPQNERRSFFRATLVDRNWAVCLRKASSSSSGMATETPEFSIESWAPTQTTRSPRQALSQEREKPRTAMASSATVKMRDLSPGASFSGQERVAHVDLATELIAVEH